LNSTSSQPAGRSRKQFLENYFRKIRYVVGLGRGADRHPSGTPTTYVATTKQPVKNRWKKVRQNVRAFLKGGGVEDFEMKKQWIHSGPLEQLHLYLGINPLPDTAPAKKLLESVAASILTLTIKPPKTGKDRMEYMRLKRKTGGGGG
jgi:hypothetical protein